MSKPKTLARVYESFGIRDAMSSMSGKVKDHLCNMVLDSTHTNSKMGLLTEIAVTHAGIVNGNMGYYPPDNLRRSAASWTTPYKKPVLAHHAKHTEPLGRNIGSIYRPSVPVMVPKVMASVYDTDFSYRGLGHLQNLVNIADPTAVQKVLDGRYETVSVSGDTDEMICSICGTNWLEDGKCEHRFGNTYEEEESSDPKLAYWTSGDFTWDELSFVNEPADPFAQIISREVDPQADDQILKVYNYKDVTCLEKQATDSKVKRLLNIYAVNDSLGASVKVNDETSLEALYKVYGQRLFPSGSAKAKVVSNQIPVGDSIGKEHTLDPNKDKAQAPAEETKVAAETKIEDTKVADTPKLEETKAEEVKESPVPEVKDEVVPEPAKTDDVKQEEVKVEDKKTPEPEAPKQDDPELKELKARLKTLEDENRTLLEQATSLQTQIKDTKINRILDLKVELQLDAYPTDGDRKKAFDTLQPRSMESLEDQLKDLEAAAAKNAKRVAPKDLKVEGVEDGKEIADPIKQLNDSIDATNPVALMRKLMSGEFNPPTR